MKKPELVTIIGAGISGISAAIYAQKKGYRVKIIEGSHSYGGIIDTFSTDSLSVELGAHSLYNSYINLLEFIQEAKLEGLLLKKKKLPFLMYENGKIHTVLRKFKKLRLSLGIIAWYLFSRRGYSISEYYTKIMGCYNYKEVLKHCFNAVLSQEAKDFPASLLFNVKKRNKSFPRQYAIQGGLSALIEKLISHYKLDITLNCKAIAINNNSDGYTIETSQGNLQSDKIIIATPVNNAVNLLNRINIEASIILSKIDVSKIISCAVVFKGSDSVLPRISGLIGVNESFYSLVSSDPYYENEHRAVVIHFKYSQNFDQQNYLERAYKLLGVAETEVISYKFKQQVVPMLLKGHEEEIRLLDDCLNKSGIQLTGNYFKRLAVEDCIARSKKAISLL